MPITSARSRPARRAGPVVLLALLLSALGCGTAATRPEEGRGPVAAPGGAASAPDSADARAGSAPAPFTGPDPVESVPPRSRHLAFVDVTVVPMDVDREMVHQTVLVEGSRITTIGPLRETEVPADATVVDGRGRWLLPGLADMHVHIWNEHDLLLDLANGVTTIRNMFGAPVHLAWKERIAAGELLGPTIVTAGPILDGDPPVWNGSVVVRDEHDARVAIASQKRAGYDFLKVYSNLTEPAYRAIAEVAEQAGMPFAGHVPKAVPLSEALELGQHTIEHLTGFADALLPDDVTDRTRPWELLDQADLSRLPALAGQVAASDTWICPTLVVFQGMLPPDQAQERLAAPELRYLDPTTRAMWDPSRDFRFKDLKTDDYAALRRGDDVRLQIVRALNAAGAKLLLGTDCLNPLVVPGFAVHDELANLRAAGLTPFQALCAATRDAARCLGQEGAFGQVIEDGRADLILADGDPLVDPSTLRHPVGVMVQGRWLPAEDLRQRMDALVAMYAAGRDRYAGLPELPAGDLTLDYEVRFNDAAFAGERSSLTVLPDGSRHVVTQLVYDPPLSVALEYDVTFGAEPPDLTLELTGHTSSGTGTATAVRKDGRLRVTGTGLYADADIDRALDDDVLIEMGPLGLEQRLCSRLMELAPGGALHLHRVGLDLDVTLTMADSDLDITRQDDEILTTAAGEIPCRSFLLASRASDGSGSVESTVWIDEHGHGVRFEQREQLGLIQVERVEQEPGSIGAGQRD